jgi:Rrf2 family transcriptional regulator, cysteine metabolism repressor
MLKLSKKVEYALISMMHMDSRHNGDLATAREMSDDYHIPGELLGKVLQSLAKVQLIQSVQGSKGGYRLVRPLEKITLGEVVQAVEGPVQIAACQGDPACCEQFTNCNIRKPVFQVQQQLLGYMFGLPLSTFRNSPAAVAGAGGPGRPASARPATTRQAG